MSDLRCPYCGDRLYVSLVPAEITGEGNQVDGIECDSLSCPARWTEDGTLRTPGVEVSPDVDLQVAHRLHLRMCEPCRRREDGAS